MTIQDLFDKYFLSLKNITEVPKKEIGILVCDVLKVDELFIYSNYNYQIPNDKLKIIVKNIKLRIGGYPLEYITKKVSFYSKEFFIEDGVLIPRSESELIIDKTIEIISKNNIRDILEIGCGSGILSITLATMFKDMNIMAVDINKKALEVSLKNAKLHKVDGQISFIQSNLFENITSNFDMVISNPPYIADNYKLPLNVTYEPSNALFGGAKGDEILKDIIIQTYQRKIPFLICEMGYDQKENLTKFIKENCLYENLEFYKDYSRFDRGFVLGF